MINLTHISHSVNRFGISLIEVVIVIGIILLLTVFSYNSFRSSDEYYALDSDAQYIIELFETSRSKTIAREQGLQYGIVVASSSVVLFNGQTFNQESNDNEEIQLSGRTHISASTTQGNIFVFEPFTGSVINTGTIKIMSRRSEQFLEIEVFPTGIVKRK
jgi:Tfp pilus assembly protein FimT